jgi:hypothetical protein
LFFLALSTISVLVVRSGIDAHARGDAERPDATAERAIAIMREHVGGLLRGLLFLQDLAAEAVLRIAPEFLALNARRHPLDDDRRDPLDRRAEPGPRPRSGRRGDVRAVRRGGGGPAHRPADAGGGPSGPA